MILTWRGWLLLSLFLLPWLGVFVAGLWWMWINNWWVLWLLAVTATTLLLWLARRWWNESFLRLPLVSACNPTWPPREEAVWQQLQVDIAAVVPEDYPIDKQLPDKLLHLALSLSLRVAQQYHGNASGDPRLAVAFPDLIHAAERVCRDLRTLSAQVPFSHALTAGQLLTLHDYYRNYGEATKNILRLGGLLINPEVQALNEVRRFLLGQAFTFSRQEVLRWVLNQYVQWVVRHSIDLYSGHAKGELLPVIGTPEPAQSGTKTVHKPLRFLVLGQSNSGKSSVIHALFGNLAPSDTAAGLHGFCEYLVARDGLPDLVICDSAGYQFPQAVTQQLDKVDFVLLTCKATEAARKPDQQFIQQFRAYFHARPQSAPPPLLVLCTHIDQLPPPRHWQPPYNINNPQSSKARNLRAALESLAEELDCRLDDIIPVSLNPVYNVEEGVIPAILHHLPQARRAQYVASLRRHEQVAFWSQLGEQAKQSGQVFMDGMGFMLYRGVNQLYANVNAKPDPPHQDS